MKSFLSSKVLSEVFGSAPAAQAEKILRVWTDTRTLQPGDLFFAIRGEAFDGHEFVEQALSKGALAAVVDRVSAKKFNIRENDSRVWMVEDTVTSLRKLAQAYRRSLSIPVIAIGGSNGKTTTKELTHFVFETLWGENQIFKTKKSENSIIGIALSLLQIRAEQIAIIEVGIDEPGWMAQHLEVVEPTHGVITTINEEHLEKLLNIETVAKEELLLLEHLVKTNGGFASNEDSPWIKNATKPENTLRYSLEESSDIEGKYFAPNRLSAFGINFEISLPGKHNSQNLLAAITLARLVNPKINLPELKEVQESLQKFKGEAHRSLWMEFGGDIKVFDDCYNANPTSMESSLQSFIEIASGLPMIAILGDMRELGDKSLTAHQRIINLASVLGFQQIFFYGPEFGKALEASKIIQDNIVHFESFEDLEAAIADVLQPGQAFFLKGSRGMKMERVLKYFERL